MKPVKQKIIDPGIGDCFRACMASLLELPDTVLPNDHSSTWFSVWNVFLGQFGLRLAYQSNNKGAAIWHTHPWIASVKSKNYKDVTHCIIVHEGSVVLHDPSTKKVYKKGTSLLGTDAVIGGHQIFITDFSLIHKLEEFRKKINRGKKNK